MNIDRINKILLCLVACLCSAEAKPYIGADQYIGCYSMFESKFTRFDAVTPKKCLTSCALSLYHLAALKRDGGFTECHCGNIFGTMTSSRVPSDFCLKPCTKSDPSCGNVNYFAVYIALPAYLGCFYDHEHRDLNATEYNLQGSMTNRLCFIHCDSEHKFSGTQFGYGCFCGDSYGKYKSAPEIECNTPCKGDPFQTCGGAWRNSVYSVSYIPYINIPYDFIFHCTDGNDSFGNCKSNALIKCQSGWKGKKCNKRDCQFNNGNCGEHRCIEFQLGNHLSSECVCNKGFGSLTIFHACGKRSNF